ncbi:MAG: hypothetical protein J5501_07115 [Ruminococcus sp.]|nr:hypothetical protein [Ruminococcus sp.]
MMSPKRIRDMLKDKSITAAIAAVGILLVLLSSLLPEKDKEQSVSFTGAELCSASDEYRRETEKQLEEFLSSIEGAGKVRVFLKTAGSERNIYVSEGKTSESKEKKEVDEKYVIVSEGGSRKALLDSVEEPEITGAAVICTGGSSSAVQEKIYRSLEALFGLPPGKIYVTKMG